MEQDGVITFKVPWENDLGPSQTSVAKLFAKIVYGWKPRTISVKTIINVWHSLKIIYKTLNNLNPSFMKQIFELRLSSRPVREQYKLNLNIPKNSQVTFGTKSLESLGAKIWNHLPDHIKSSKNLNVFKNLIKKWNGSSCSCDVCALLYLSTILFHRWFLCYFCKLLLDPEFNSTCKHFIKSFE